MNERKALLGATPESTRPEMARLASALASAIAHNLLIPDLHYRVKNNSWMVLNLNRLLCVHYDLPLGYGLFKERRLKTLCEWLDKPFEPANAKAPLL